MKQARGGKFKNINLDLIYATPTQTMKDLIYDVESVTDLEPHHISIYGLTIEENTPFSKINKYQPDEELSVKMYEYLINKLPEKGYNHYEISNFSQPSFESKHNLAYWDTEEEYLGVGLGAHSYLKERDGYVRFENRADLKSYQSLLEEKKLPISEKILLNRDDLISEFIFLGLRRTSGISKRAFLDRFGIDIYDIYGSELKKLISQNLLVDEDDKIFIKKDALIISNQIMSHFV